MKYRSELSRTEKNVHLGNIGQNFIIGHFSRLGNTVEPALDPYDSKKDLLIDGLKAEVKTQGPYRYKNAFTFKPNQLEKCSKVDRLFFIAAPVKGISYAYDGCVFEVDSKAFVYSSFFPKRGPWKNKEMYAVAINQPAVRLIHKLPIETQDLLSQYTVTEY